MISDIINKWLELPTGSQFLAWICTFCLMLMVGIGILVNLDTIFAGDAFTYGLLISFGIGSFLMFFLAVVFYFTFLPQLIDWFKSMEDKEH